MGGGLRGGFSDRHCCWCPVRSWMHCCCNLPTPNTVKVDLSTCTHTCTPCQSLQSRSRPAFCTPCTATDVAWVSRMLMSTLLALTPRTSCYRCCVCAYAGAASSCLPQRLHHPHRCCQLQSPHPAPCQPALPAAASLQDHTYRLLSRSGIHAHHQQAVWWEKVRTRWWGDTVPQVLCC
jgi:hypothetical protein